MIRLECPFEFGTKAETLERLAPLLTLSSVPTLLSFGVAAWKEGERESILDEIVDRFGPQMVIVRSSAQSEDGAESSLAGAFESVSNLAADNRFSVAAAIDKVIESYGQHATPRHGSATLGRELGDDHVIVQTMIRDVEVSGVVFTQDLNTGAPYYVINYDDESGTTDTVTAGNGYTNRTLYVFRDQWTRITSKRFLNLLKAVREIEGLTRNVNLDIECAIDHNQDVHIFQVRPIATQQNWNRGQSLRISDALVRVEEALVDRYAHTGDAERLGGSALGNMPDWNPAEMIGTSPAPLALSLYRRLITDRVWRAARHDMGYRENHGAPLMIALAGQPYIDVRESLSSLIPATITEDLTERLVAAWLERLRANPHLHDKIEFDVAITALTPDFDHRVCDQLPGVLSPSDVANFRLALTDLTNNLLTGAIASIPSQLETVATLTELRLRTLAGSAEPRIETVLQLLEDAATYGTRPFSVLARHAFIAAAILRGLVEVGALSVEDADLFHASIPTVATDFIRDVDLFRRGELSEAKLDETYGHLRPGTYNILAKRYGDHRFDQVINTRSKSVAAHEPKPFEMPIELRRVISSVLQRTGYVIDAEAMFDYMRRAIQSREFAKLCFTRNVSDALEIIKALGVRHGLSAQEMSFIEIGQLIDCFVQPAGRSIESELRRHAEMGHERHQIATTVRLPSLITKMSDLWIVPLLVEQPNYITRQNIDGEIILINGGLEDPSLIDGKIVAVESADPGFDWIFTRPIIGLVTRFGGANSHMAIRCAEFGLPAAIGCGEQIFARIVNRGQVSLNCGSGQIVMGH